MARDTIYALYATGRTDPTYKHIWGFEKVSDRDTFLQNKEHIVFAAQKYWRPGASIKIPVSYEDSFKYDYAVITNKTNSTPFTWYAFITSRAYISNNVTELSIDTDIVQTYYFSYQVDGVAPFWNTSGFITRRTGKTIPQRGTASDFVPIARNIQKIWYQPNVFYPVIFSSVDLTKDELSYSSWSVDGIIMSSCPYVVIGSDNADTLRRFAALMEKVNTNGWTGSISNVCVIPFDMVVETTEGVHPLAEKGTKERFDSMPKPTDCGGYVPKNKVLLEQDYSYVVINNNLGEEIKYRFDEVTGDAVNIVTGVSYNSGSVELYSYVSNFKDTDAGAYRMHAQKMTSVPLCTYDNDTYKIWLAQTQNTRAVQTENARKEIAYASYARDTSSSYQMSKYISPVISTITRTAQKAGESLESIFAPKADTVTTMGGTSGMGFGGGRSEGTGAGRSFTGNTAVDTMSVIKSAGQNKNLGGALGALAGLYTYKMSGIENAASYDISLWRAQDSLSMLYASYADKALVSATAAGSNMYGGMTTFNQVGFTICLITPTYESAQQLDNMITASGVTYNKYDFFYDQHYTFDYIAMTSADIPVDVEHRPQYARNLLLSLLDSGLYIWYYRSGDIDRHYGSPYGVDNPEV